MHSFPLCAPCALLLSGRAGFAAEPQLLSVAVFDFESKDEAVRDLGPKVSALLNASLSADPNLIIVERAELEKALGEQELGLSGTVSPDTAAKVGHLTGAKVLVTGECLRSIRTRLLWPKSLARRRAGLWRNRKIYRCLRCF